MFGHIPEGYYQQIKIDDEKAKLEQLRDQFAMAALTGMLANHVLVKALLKKHEVDKLSGFFEENAYIYADAMLEARKEKK